MSRLMGKVGGIRKSMVLSDGEIFTILSQIGEDKRTIRIEGYGYSQAKANHLAECLSLVEQLGGVRRVRRMIDEQRVSGSEKIGRLGSPDFLTRNSPCEE